MSPASSDPTDAAFVAGGPRPAGTAAVHALLDQATAAGSGAVRLPAMTAAELCVLGAMATSLIDAGAWTWWTSAPPAHRPALREMAWQFLASRRLVTAESAGREAASRLGLVRVATPAALIVAGRTRPAFIVLGRHSVAGEPERTRMYGIADARHGLRAVLVEDARPGQASWAGPVYEFGLASPAAAARALASWAAAPGPTHRRSPMARLIDIYRPGTRDMRPAARITVHGGDGGLRVLTEPGRLTVTNPLRCDEDVLTSLLTHAMTGACP